MLPTSRPYILCVDDEKIVLDTLLQQLRMTFGPSCEYETAESVEEAWELIDEIFADEGKLALVVSDWLIPPERGDTFLTELHQRWPNVRLIMLSGQADPDAIARVERLPSLLAFVAKPWNRDELMGLIRSHLQTEEAAA